jgi:hypothetical protein
MRDSHVLTLSSTQLMWATFESIYKKQQAVRSSKGKTALERVRIMCFTLPAKNLAPGPCWRLVHAGAWSVLAPGPCWRLVRAGAWSVLAPGPCWRLVRAGACWRLVRAGAWSMLATPGPCCRLLATPGPCWRGALSQSVTGAIVSQSSPTQSWFES